MLLYRLLDWIGKLTGTIILTPHPYTIGNCAEHIYFGLLKARREGKKLVILFPYELPWRLKFPLTNVEVVNIESDYRYQLNHALYVAGRILITAYFGFFRALSLLKRVLLGRHMGYLYRIPAIGTLTLWQPEEDMTSFSWDVVDRYEWDKVVNEPLPVCINRKRKKFAEGQRVRMGLPLDSWFVCLHVRESGFYKDQDHDRNADINNYIEAIKEITSRGGWVVRMGDATMIKLPPMDRVIDYPFTGFKSALMDVYLISECRFYIGMTSGIYDVAQLFQRPMISVNLSSWLFGTLKKGDIGLMKHIYSKSGKRFLSIREWLAEPFEAHAFMPLGSDYVFHENDQQELKAVVKEYLDRDDRWEPTPLQHEFNELRIRFGKKLIGESVISGFESDIIQRYRLGFRLKSSLGVMGAEYLEQNWEHSSKNRL